MCALLHDSLGMFPAHRNGFLAATGPRAPSHPPNRGGEAGFHHIFLNEAFYGIHPI